MNTIKTSMKPACIRALSAAVAIILVVSITVIAGISVYAASYPKPVDCIADSANILSEGTIRSIKNSNESTAAKVGAVIAVCTVSTTGETPIGEYARAVFNDWQLGESILILIATDDMNYYLLQSTLIDSVLTNDDLREITDKYLEEDFVSGNIDSGVIKVATKLSSVLSEKLPEVKKAVEGESTGTTLGSVIVGFFKVILFIVLFAIVAVAVLFIAALFNDTAAEIFRRYILRRKEHNSVPVIEYDERLYGNAQRRPQSRPNQNQQRRPQQNGYGDPAQQNGYRPRRRPDQYTGYENFSSADRDAYYDSTGTRRR